MVQSGLEVSKYTELLLTNSLEFVSQEFFKDFNPAIQSRQAVIISLFNASIKEGDAIQSKLDISNDVTVDDVFQLATDNDDFTIINNLPIKLILLILSDEQFKDLSIFVISFIWKLSTLSELNKSSVSEVNEIPNLLTKNFQYYNGYVDQFNDLMKLMKLTPKSVLFLFESLKQTSNLDYLELLYSLLDKKYNSYLNFKNSSLIIKSIPKRIGNNYTIQTWLKLNSLSENEIFSINNRLQLKLEASKLVCYFKNKLIGSFDSYQFENSEYYHLVLSHSVSPEQPPVRAKLRLYVNGNYIQHLRCPLPYPSDDGSLESKEFTVNLGGASNTDFNISNFLVMNGTQNYEWILISYFLGRQYTGSYQDPDILRCLNYEERAEFNLSLLESTNNRQGEYDIRHLHVTIPKDDLIFNLNNEYVNFSNDLIVENSVIKSNPDLENSNVRILGELFMYNNETFSEVFYSVSGLQLILTLIEKANEKKTLYKLVSLFVKLININWKFIQETESNNYFNILSRLLRYKKHEFKENFDMELFDIFLGFAGYNFQSPFNSVINNHFAYDSFIFDFQLWRPLNQETLLTHEDTAILEFLLFQITVFARECKYANFNTLKLKKLKVVKKLLHALNQGIIPNKLNSIFSDALLTLVKGNLTQETISTLSSFVIYSLNENNKEIGLLLLKVLAEVFLDPLISSSSYFKKIFASCSIKWILLLLDLAKDSKELFEYGLSFLIKIFTLSRKTYDLFIRNNGLSALLSTLRDVKFDEVEINLLIKGSFGHYQYNMNFEKLYEPLDPYTLTTVEFHELNYLIIDALEWAVLNDIFIEGGKERIIRMSTVYSEFVNVVVQENTSFQSTLESDMIYIKKICNMILLWNKPTNTPTYFECSQKFITILANIIITKLFSADTNSLEAYLLSILKHEPALENQLNSVPTVFIALVFPHVLVHLKGFSSEFSILLETNGIKFSNLAVFLGILNNELLSFEWNSKDYFNYLSVLLDITEAYRSTKKSLRYTYYINLLRSVTLVVNSLICVLKSATSHRQEENFLKVLMYHQQEIFSKEYLTNDGISNVISLLLKISSNGDPLVTNLSCNCLRMILIQRQEDLSAICSCITYRSFLPVSKYLGSVITATDDEVVSGYLEGKIKEIFTKHLDGIVNKVDKKYNKDSFTSAEIKINKLVLNFDNIIKTKYELLDALYSTFRNDNETLRLKIVSSETMRSARYTQDQQDNLQFYLLQYNKFKAEANKLSLLQSGKKDPTSIWRLSNMEGIDRMRKVLLPYDKVEIDKNLKNIVPLPKKVNNVKSTENSKAETQSLKSFEFIEPDVIDESLNTYNDRNRKVLKCLLPGDKIQELWNVSQVIGLDIIEGVFILGETHLYIIQNYFHKAENDEIIDIDEASEDQRDPNIKLITGQSSENLKKISKSSNRHSSKTWDLFKLTSVTKRRFLLRDVALELFFSNGASILITATKTKGRDIIFSKLSSVATNSHIDNDLSTIFKETNLNNQSSGANFTTKLANVFGAEYLNYLDATKKWQNGEMSNFYYLMIVNTFAGRTFNDLTQYPVFPWVIADYTSEELDLNDPKSFRDLTKPMGAQGEARARQFKERYEALQSLCDDEAPPFHYGTHYSSAMIVASFLIRLEPYVQSYLLLQGGRFDHPDRLFYSIQKAWKSSSAENTTDVRELIPEFFFLPEFLTNGNKYEFGKLQDGTEVCDVELPRWAKGDPQIFIAKNREALESPYVSEHLHAWIDLIFGYKQTGPEAVEAINVFNHLSYRGAIDLDSINNADERRSITGIIHNFGQTPTQIFNKPHPEREINTILKIEPNLIKKNPTLIYQTKFKEPIQFLHFKTHSDNAGDAFWRGYPGLHLNGDIEIKKGTCPGSLIINRQTFERLHDEEITTLARFDHETLLTGSESGVIHVWRYLVKIKGFNEILQFETRLRAHTAAIKELKVSPEFNLLLSLDINGDCYLWNLAKYKLIRKISSDDDGKFEHIAMSYDSGLIAVSYGSKVKIFNVNGELIYEGSIKEEGDDGDISVLSFANSRTVSTIKLNNVESHESWKYIGLLTTGWTNGVVKLHELKINKYLKDGSYWILENLKTLKFYDGKVTLNDETVTVVETYLKSYFNYDDEKVGKIEIVAGDINGRVAVWRQ